MLTRREIRRQRHEVAAPGIAADPSAARDARERSVGAASTSVTAVTEPPLLPAGQPAATVRILVVCTANVIRSALTERALRQQFALVGADRLEFSSAGTRAAVGQGMWRESVEIARVYGFDYRDFVARQLDDAILADVDYVIAAAREHREAVMRRRPDLAARTFTFRELVRILDGREHPDLSAAHDPADRFVQLAAWADARRDLYRAALPEDDDLVDPSDGGREALWTLEKDLVRGVVTIVTAVSGEYR